MGNTANARTTKHLNMAHNIVMNCLDKEGVISSLEAHGFSRSMLEKGKALYESATFAVGEELVAEEKVNQAAEQIDTLQKAIKGVYSGFILLAKKFFGKDALATLEIHSSMPRSNQACCERARITFRKAFENEQLKLHLAKNGFGNEQIQSACSLIETYDNTAKLSFDLKLALDNAIYKRQIAFSKLQDWLALFAGAATAAIKENSLLASIVEIEPEALQELTKPNYAKVLATKAI